MESREVVDSSTEQPPDNKQTSFSPSLPPLSTSFPPSPPSLPPSSATAAFSYLCFGCWIHQHYQTNVAAVILSGQNTNKAVSSWLLKRALAGQEYGARTFWPTMDLPREKVKDETRDGSRKWMTIHRGTVVQILNSIFRQKEQPCI